MTEQHGFRFTVDASDAAKGWGQFEAAVEGVFTALDRMESHVSKTMAAVNRNTRSASSGIKQFAQAGKMLSGIKLDGRATSNIASLSTAMRNFKAPSSAQVKNLRDFFKALQIAGTGGGAAAARNIGALNSAMAGFKAPSSSNVKNLRGFFSAIATFRNNGLANAAGMFSTLRQISGFKAPSATQIRNLQAFLTSVSNLQIPRNGAQIARVLEQIARASSAANTGLRGVRGAIGGFNWGRFNAGARSASLNMMGLQNAFSGTYQMGSVLRSLLGSLTIAELGRSFFEADNRLQTFNASMGVISKEAGFAGDQLNYVTSIASRLGLDYGAAADAFGKFAISADKAGASTAQARDIFEGFATAMSVMGLSADRQTDVMLALQQSMNKGYLAGEELNQQLNEHLPGALGYLRTELKKHGKTLETELKNKTIDATQALLFLASKYREEFGPVLAKALDRPAAQMNILRTNITKLFEAIANNGGNQGFVDFLKRINAYMRPEDIQRYGKAIGELINKYMTKLANAVDWLAKNWDSLKGPLSFTLSLLGKWLVISGMMQIGKFFVTPMINAGSALRTFIPFAQQSLILMRAMNAQSLGGLLASVRNMNPATLKLFQNLTNMRTALTNMPKNPFTMLATGARSMFASISKIPKGFLGAAIGVGVFQAAMQGTMSTSDELAAKNYTTTEVITGYFSIMGDKVSNLWGKMTKWMRENWGFTFINLSDVLSGFGKFIGNFFINLAFGMQKFVKLIWLTFKSAFQGILNQITLVAQSLGSLFNGDFAAAGAKAKEFFTGGGFKESFVENFKGFFSNMGGQRNQFAANVYKGFDAAGSRGRGGDGGPRSNQSAAEQASSLYDPTKLLTEGKGDKDKDGKKKTPRKHREKVVDPAKELDKLQRAVDGMMKRLAEDNPVLKLQQDYVNDLTEQAQLLLTDGGYNKWMADLAKNGGNAETAMIDLTDALTGAGVDQKVLTDLATRYGVKVEDITGMLQRQQEAYRYKKEQAELDAKFGGKVLKDMDDQIRLARLSGADQKALSAVLDEVRSKREKGIVVGKQEIDQLYEQLKLRERYMDMLQQERDFYTNNGVRTYLADLKSAGEAVHELDKNALQSLEDTIYTIGKEGKISFTSLFDTIQDGLLRFASQNITGAITNLITDKSDPKNPTVFGGLFKMMGFKTGFDKNKAAQRFDAQNVDLYTSTVTVTGDMLSGPLGSKFGASGANGLDANGDIVVNAKATDGLQQQIMDSLGVANTKSATDLQKKFSQAIGGVGGTIQSVFSNALMSLQGGMGGGGGGLFGSLLNLGMSFIPGGNVFSSLSSSAASTIAANPGIFKEGGISTSPVARWGGGRSAFSNAPHYSEGTHNTTPGIPAVLHDNEAVIPLSRGRKVPVQLTNDSGRGSGTVVNNTWNVTSPNADSFKRSQQQVTNQMHRAATRATQRNN